MDDTFFSWIYILFVGIDANFQLKHHNISADATDPSLNGGLVYFVEENTFKTHLLLCAADPQEVFFFYLNLRQGITHSQMKKSTCSVHTAINLVNSKKSHGFAATRVGMMNCTHHNMKLSTTIGDLQKGEK